MYRTYCGSYTLNFKTAEPDQAQMSPGKVYGWSNFQNLASQQNSISKSFKIYEIFLTNPRPFFVLFYNVYKEKTSQLKKKMA